MRARRAAAKSKSQAITARDVAKVIASFASVYNVPGAGNARVATALKRAADMIAALGDQPMTKLPISTLRLSNEELLPVVDFSNISVSEVRRLLDNPGMSKTRLVEMAFVRFGMPKARLLKLPIEDALEAIAAAAANEESLEIIAKNADQSGRERQA